MKIEEACSCNTSNCARFQVSSDEWLGYASFGDPQGFPILYFHGCPGSRLEAALTNSMAATLGFHVIGIDRPGYGQTTAESPSLKKWSILMHDFIHYLGIEGCSILGVSGGGPYALACAAYIPELLHKVGYVCGLGPLGKGNGLQESMWPTRLAFFGFQAVPFLTKNVFRLLGRAIYRWPFKAVNTLQAFAPEPDSTLLQSREIREKLGQSFREAMSQGVGGVINDLTLYTQPWDFDLKDITADILLWHGDKDVTIPLSMGKYTANSLKRCTPCYVEGEGHFSLPIRCMRSILLQLGKETMAAD